MRRNRGATSLKTRRRAENPMREFDRLPPELRAWVAGAVLPWRPGSVRRAYDKAVARTKDPALALGVLDQIQARMVARDAGKIWGRGHPTADLRDAEARAGAISPGGGRAQAEG